MALTGHALCALLLAGGVAPAAPGPTVAPGSFSHITVEDGLPHSYVRAILEDRDGFMWFATARGLVRYDGARLVVYRHDPDDPGSLPFGEPTCLFEDRERRLWVGTASSRWAGIGVLDRGTGRFTRYLADGRPGSLSAPYVQAIYQDREGRLWVGHAQGVDLFDPAAKTFTAFPIGPEGSEPRVMAMVEDSRGTFWVATERSGLFQLDRATRTFRGFSVRDRAAAGARDPDDPFFAAFLEQPAGTLWVAGYGAGLVRIDLDQRANQALPPRSAAYRLAERRPGGARWRATATGSSTSAPRTAASTSSTCPRSDSRTSVPTGPTRAAWEARRSGLSTATSRVSSGPGPTASA